MVGLRGVGKTVLLDRMRQDAEESGIQTIRVEAPEQRSLPALLAPQLRVALLRLSKTEKAKDLAVRALKVKYQDIEVGVDYEPEPGLADNGDLEHDLQALLEVAGAAAQEAGTALVLFIDELQYVPEEQLAALIVGLHRASQRQLPVVLVGAGRPQLRGRMGRAKSYAERLFDFPEIGPLPPEAARIAIAKPATAQGVEFTDEALEHIVQQTKGYPYFLQEWGKRAWDTAAATPITGADVDRASAEAVAALDESFFRVRFDRLTPAEKRYLRAMADLGPALVRDEAVTMTSMYNVIEKLRSGESLAPKERRVHETAACGVLKDLHDELDALVANAYGWEWPLEKDVILERLVALHDERVKEEKAGKVCWLRPDFRFRDSARISPSPRPTSGSPTPPRQRKRSSAPPGQPMSSARSAPSNACWRRRPGRSKKLPPSSPAPRRTSSVGMWTSCS